MGTCLEDLHKTGAIRLHDTSKAEIMFFLSRIREDLSSSYIGLETWDFISGPITSYAMWDYELEKVLFRIVRTVLSANGYRVTHAYETQKQNVLYCALSVLQLDSSTVVKIEQFYKRREYIRTVRDRVTHNPLFREPKKFIKDSNIYEASTKESYEVRASVQNIYDRLVEWLMLKYPHLV